MLHHGYKSSAEADFCPTFCDQLRERAPHALILNSSVNTGAVNNEGIMACAHRLREEILAVVGQHRTLKKISLVGLSMGGLICRAAAYLMFDEDKSTVAGLVPCTLCCLASPMVGIRRTLPTPYRWALKLFGDCVTVREMLLEDGDPGAIMQLTSPPHLKALASFHTRKLGMCTHGDVICPYSTAALVPWAPSSEPEDNTSCTGMRSSHMDDKVASIPEFDLFDLDKDGMISREEFIGACGEETSEQRASEFDRVDLDHNGSLSREEFEAAYGTRGDYTVHFPGDSDEYEMLRRLRTLSWERHDLFVTEEQRIWVLGAHGPNAVVAAHEWLLRSLILD